MKISIVIPVYNEADRLDACLRSIAAQKAAPYEVIVVDNNSTDTSIAVTECFDFVTILHEPKQGVVHARATGFNAARGDVIARIDADSILPSNWTEVTQVIFADKSVDATSGIALYYNVAAAPLFNAVDLFFRRRLSLQLKGRVFLWGANMAIRRSAWKRVKPALCKRSGIHEDYDIAIHLQEIGGRVTFDERMRAKVSSRRIDVGYFEFMKYVWVSPKTYAQHGVRGYRHMYWVVMACAVGYLPARVLHRGYDPTFDRFMWSKVFAPSTVIPRVDPTTNVV